jgi:Ca2+-binding RTX toxin-like protein
LLSTTPVGTLVFGADGKFTYTPQAGFTGTDVFTYLVSDGRGGTSVGTVEIVVTAEPEVEGTIQLVEDATQPGRMALVINGTSRSEFIAVLHSWNGVQVFFGCESRGVFQPTGRILVHANGGNDVVLVGPGVQQAAWLYGDEGNDVLKLGHGGGIAFGGADNDLVSGGNGRDVLVGGEGADLLVGNAGDDILVSAITVYDNRSNPVHENAWAGIHAEWNSARSFEQRVASLRGGGGGLNGTYFLNDTTVADDTASSCDILTGSSGRDWYVYRFGEDRVIGLSSTEAIYDQGIA